MDFDTRLGERILTMAEFVYLIRPTRDNFMETMTEKEMEIMDRHFEYLKGYLSEKKLILAGPCLDAAFGIVIFQADSLDTAREMMENDPAVLGGVMSSELHPYRVSLFQNNYKNE